MRRWLVLFLLIAGVILVATRGGRLLDLTRINRISLQTLEARAPAPAVEPEAQTQFGACRLAHATGRFYLSRRQYDQALPYLEQGVACNTGRLAEQWAWFDLAQTQLALGDMPAAAGSFAQADGYEYVVRLARQAAADQEEVRQIELWRLAIAVDPGRQTAYIQLARAYAENAPEREALLQDAIENDPIGRDAYLELAEFYSRRGQLEAADEVLEEAMERLPEEMQVLQALAANASSRGQVSQAIEYYQRVAAMSETEGERAAAYYAVGNLTAADNNWASALAFYRLAAIDEPERPAHLLALGQAYQANGCPDQAGQIYQRLLNLTPDADTIAAAEAGLAETAGLPAEPDADCPPLP